MSVYRAATTRSCVAAEPTVAGEPKIQGHSMRQLQPSIIVVFTIHSSASVCVSERLRRLQQIELVERKDVPDRQRTSYRFTKAGIQLKEALP